MTGAAARLALALAVAGFAAGVANAAETVTIGALYALAQDSTAKAATETAAAIVNAPHQGLEKLPLGAGQGLPSLGGAKIGVTFADDLGNPSVAPAQALRLVTQDHVAALIGGGDAAEILAATALADRHGLPFLVADGMAPSVTGRGLKFVFRSTPLGGDIAKVYGQFLAAPEQGGKVHSIALVFEDSDFGRERAAGLRDGLKAAGFAIGDIAYPADAADLSAPVAQLHAQNPDAVILISHPPDAILFAKTMKNAGYKPPIEIGDDAGFSDAAFVTAVGNLAQGVIDRNTWSAGKPNSVTAIVNSLFRAKSGRDLDDATAQIVQGFLVLADAINRAGSTDAAAIQTALQQTDLKPDQLIVGYDGVKFDATGQNRLAATFLTQLQGKQYVIVWPPATAAGKPILPFKGWE